MRDVIIEVTSDHLHNTRVKENFVSSTCPFHKGGMERSPSFWVNLSTGSWGCFTCHEHGNSFQDLMQKLAIPGLRYKELIQDAEREAKKTAAHRRRINNRKAVSDFKGLHIMPDALLGLYDYTPLELVDDGYSEEILNAHDIGYDPKRNRIVFPIRDIYGNLVGISGRQPDGQVPKYKVYTGWHEVNGKRHPGELGEFFPSYKADDVRNHLWRGQFVFDDLLNNKHPDVILVEGYKAALWLVQCGWPYTVAAMGSMISEQQTRIFKTMGADVWVLFDANEPGRVGSRKVCEKLSTGSFKVYECSYGDLPEWTQPDDLSAEGIREILASAKRKGVRHARSVERFETSRQRTGN